MNVILDLETRSRADLPSVGSFRYAVDPSTEILMAGVATTEPGTPVYLWVNPKYGKSDPEALDLLREADLVYAHQAMFELALLWGKGLPQVRVKLEQWRCTMAMARTAGLPSGLAQLAEALGLEQKKDTLGKKLIKLFSIPQKDGTFTDPLTHPAEWKQFCEYCRQDVRTERAVHRRLAAFELKGESLATFQFDLRMNLRGIPVNVPALRNAQKIIDDVEGLVTAEFRTLTGLNPTQRQKILELLQSLGVKIEDMQADTLDRALENVIFCGNEGLLCGEDASNWEKAQRILELYRKLAYAAIKKVTKMLDWACPDDRLRGVFTYYGAGTGRWSASGPQLHNAKVPTPEMRPLTEEAYAAIGKGITAEGLDLIYGEPYEVLASSIRHFVHLPGSELLDGDYNAIEARIICWLAGEAAILEKWRTGQSLYKFMASLVYGIPESSVTEDQRQFGKRIELGCGFGMGPDKFMQTCEQYHVACDQELAERSVKLYRKTHPKVVNYWWALDNCMKAAIRVEGSNQGVISTKRVAGMLYMFARLPSGRLLAYPRPELNRRPPTLKEKQEMAKGKEYPESRFQEVTYWGQLPLSKQWDRVKTYGGSLAENLTQGCAADIMAHGAIVAEARGMPPFALIHDQGLSVRPPARSAEDYAAALGDLPAWAKNLPVKVEASVKPWYSK